MFRNDLECFNVHKKSSENGQKFTKCQIYPIYGLVNMSDSRQAINTCSSMPPSCGAPLKSPTSWSTIHQIFFSFTILCYWPEHVTQHSQTWNFKRITLVFQIYIFFAVPNKLFKICAGISPWTWPVHQRSPFSHSFVLGKQFISRNRCDGAYFFPKWRLIVWTYMYTGIVCTLKVDSVWDISQHTTRKFCKKIHLKVVYS